MRGAIIGTGWGRAHVGTLRAAGVEVVALVGIDATRTAAIAEREGVPLGTTALDAIDDVDVVVVAAPSRDHAALVERFAHARLICEKPLTWDRPPPSLLALAASAGERIVVSYALPFVPSADAFARRAREAGPRAVRVALDVRLDGEASVIERAREIAGHPLALVRGIVGPLAPLAPPQVTLDALYATLAGSAPVALAVGRAARPGIDYAIEVDTAAGTLAWRGQYRVGEPWRFGDDTDGAGDPWYAANVACVGAAVRAWRDPSARDPRSLTARDAIVDEHALRAALGAG